MDFDEPSDQLHADLSDHNIFSTPVPASKCQSHVLLPGYKEELTTKRAVELLLAGTLKTKVCRYCLNIVSSLSELDQILQVAGTGALYKVTIRDMVASFYPFKVESDSNLPNKICNKCLNRTISAYLFTQQCERSERALRNCFDDMYDKLEKLDSLERKKRGRQKLNPNYDTLYVEHERVIDYAEPIINLVNVKSVSLSKETAMSDLECPKCWQLFTNIEDLMLHEKTHPSSMWFNCRLCGKSFVKRLQLKRHLKQMHMKPVPVPIESQDEDKFECKTCDLTSHDYSTHLQHMEKHKFQTVLEHIVEKDMDKLCAVCLEKDPKLVDLDKMVRLHGGYPGVTGDKSVYSILGSTLPDKSYKYQELHVPHHAKILKFTKLTKDKEPEKFNHSRKKETKINLNQIIISNPLIISNDKIDADEMYMFFFSDASFYKEKQEVNSQAIKETVASLEYKDVEVSKWKTKDMNEQSGKTHQNQNTNNSPNAFIFNTTQAIINEKEHKINSTGEFIPNEEKVCDKIEKVDSKVTESKETKTAKNIKNCKTCWIFGRPTCTTCINKHEVIFNEIVNNAEDRKQVEDNTRINFNIVTNDCKYCWLFKSCAKCDFCKKMNEDKPVTNSTKTEENYNKDTKYSKELVNSNSDAQRKRKLKSFETNPKSTKWDCHVCLITNVIDRQTCVCCGSSKCEHDQNESFKVNWNFKNPLKLTPDNDVDHQIKINPSCEEMDVETENLQHTEERLITKNESYNLNINLIKESETFVYTENAIEDTEKMDVTDVEPCETIPVYPNPYLLNVVPNNVEVVKSSLPFNIGVGSSERSIRKISKPIRRMAYHK